MPIPPVPGHVSSRYAPPDSPLPSDVPVPPDDGPATARLRDPGELAAAIPMLLGFHPQESLVVVALGGRSGTRLGLAVRADLPPLPESSDLADEVACSLMHDSPAAAAVVVVSTDVGDVGSMPHSRLVEHLLGRLDELDIEVRVAIHVQHTDVGAPWRCYGPCRCSGALPDPTGTPFAAALGGEALVHPDRSAVERSVRPADPGRIRRREERLTELADAEVAGMFDPSAGGAASVCGGDRSLIVLPVVDPDIGIAALDAAITEMARVEEVGDRSDERGDDRANAMPVLDDHTVLALATALTLPEVFDAAVLRCLGRDATAAERLWAALTRETPDPEAAEPAGLLVFSAMLRGDVTLARIALERMESAWPGHRLATFLELMVGCALHPVSVRECVGALLSDWHAEAAS